MATLTVNDPHRDFPPLIIKEGIITVHGEPDYLEISHYERGVTKVIATVPRDVQIRVEA